MRSSLHSQEQALATKPTILADSDKFYYKGTEEHLIPLPWTFFLNFNFR